MQVKALRIGFYDNKRRREGQVFEMAEADLKIVDGKLLSPLWVELLEEIPKAQPKVRKVKEDSKSVSDQEVI